VTQVWRLTVTAIDIDPRDQATLAAAHLGGFTDITELRTSDLYFVAGDLTDADRQQIHTLLVDPLLSTGTWDLPTDPAIEISLLPGVADRTAQTLFDASQILHLPVIATATGRRVGVTSRADTDVGGEQRSLLATRVLANPVIERWSLNQIEPAFAGGEPSTGHVEQIDFRDLDEAGLARINRERALHFDAAELTHLQAHYQTLGREPTDAELETFAQTWSEHCSHKTFRATLITQNGERLDSLLQQLRTCTEQIDAPFVQSAFVGNAGIVSFVPGISLALKAETHNHPSAVEPFGGANTGVGGVVRDILGSRHLPVALTDILCFGPPDTPASNLPEATLHPQRIRDGVVAGVADYGNKIGVPTVAGAVLFDEGYTLNPLVFCGCVGIGDGTPVGEPAPGDRVIVIGGRTGRDGVRGATFSSAAMDASTGHVAGARVQIGDPIIAKLLIDLLGDPELRYRSLTDCGAGGLSSAVGELADGVGADIELLQAPVKYPGLEPWEIWLSEAQERMVLAVDPTDMATLEKVCARHGVEWADLGAFTGDQRLIVRYADTPIVDLDLDLLHRGRPGREMRAHLPQLAVSHEKIDLAMSPDEVRTALLGLLGHINLCSRLPIIRRYDHEVRGATAIRPYHHVPGAPLLTAGPNDAAIISEPTADHGFGIGLGVNPWFGIHDPEAMGWAVVDEAIRNAVATGVDPDRIALLDNFSWADPTDPEVLGALTATVAGACAAAIAFRAPFVSGKDSLNNTHIDVDGIQRGVPPTLVITAVGHVPDVTRTCQAALRTPGNLLVLTGETRAEWAGSHLQMIRPDYWASASDHGIVAQPDHEAPERYRRLHALISAGLVEACHDLSEGGLAVAVAEMMISGGLGVALSQLDPEIDLVTALFSESVGRHLIEVTPQNLPAITQALGSGARVIGEVTAEQTLRILKHPPITLEDLRGAHHRDLTGTATGGNHR
jgi:phosphoribosylformylglycinamidine synthase subunit PurSL